MITETTEPPSKALSRSKGRNKPRGFPVASCGCKCSNINLVGFGTPVSEQLRGIGNPAEQMLRTFTAGKELHRDGDFLVLSLGLPHATNKVL